MQTPSYQFSRRPGKGASPLSWWRGLLGLVLLLCGQGAYALGLGDITVRSYLGQPLVARIELLSNSEEELEGVSAALASTESFQLIGIDRLSLSVPLQFTVQPELPGAGIEVRSTSAISDPVLRFVVEVTFANGRLLREYTLFLDPPTYQAPVPLPAITSRQQPPAVQEAPPPARPDSETPPETPGVQESPAAAEILPESPREQLSAAEAEAPEPDFQAVAETAGAESASGPEPVMESEVEPVVESEPSTEAVPESSGDVAGEVAEPTAESADSAPTVQESAEQEEAPGETEVEAAATERTPAGADPAGEAEGDPAPAAPIPQPSVPQYQASLEDLETYGPVQSGQTMWGIASQVAADSAFSVNQVMLAIQRYNPEAFARSNINLLREGSILRLPPASEVARLSAAQAMREAVSQAEDHASIMAGRAPEARPAPLLAERAPELASEPITRPSPSDAEPSGRLQLVPPDSSADENAAGAGAGAEPSGPAGAARTDLDDLSEEERANAEQEAAYLSERLRELQQESGQDDAAVEVGDTGLAELEARLREDRTNGTTPEPIVVAPPRDEKAWFTGLGWWLAGLLLVLAGATAWWLRRRRPDETLAAAETARAIAGEAEEILRVLEPDVGRVERAAEDGDDTRDGESAKDAAVEHKVVDLEDYIGHETNPGAESDGDPEPESAQDDEALSDDEVLNESQDENQQNSQASSGSTDEGGSPDPTTRISSVTNDEEAVELDADDPETKLDLARAYISMGDTEAARKLLEDVIGTGNEAQVREARSMLEEI